MPNSPSFSYLHLTLMIGMKFWGFGAVIRGNAVKHTNLSEHEQRIGEATPALIGRLPAPRLTEPQFSKLMKAGRLLD